LAKRRQPTCTARFIPVEQQRQKRERASERIGTVETEEEKRENVRGSEEVKVQAF